MTPKYKNRTLLVLAIPEADVREIDENGSPLRDVRYVGKDSEGNLGPAHCVPYHTHYIAKLKEGSLLAASLETAQLAGVSYPSVRNN